MDGNPRSCDHLGGWQIVDPGPKYNNSRISDTDSRDPESEPGSIRYIVHRITGSQLIFLSLAAPFKEIPADVEINISKVKLRGVSIHGSSKGRPGPVDFQCMPRHTQTACSLLPQ